MYEPSGVDLLERPACLTDPDDAVDLMRFRDECGLTQSNGELIVLSADGSPVERITLERPSILVGSANGCDIQLQHPDVSYRHAYLQLIDNQILCCDLASRTGIRRDASNVVSQWLCADDVISIGPYSIRFSARRNGRSAATRRGATATNPRSAPSLQNDLTPEVTLEILSGSSQPISFHVKRDVTLIGNSRNCKVRLMDSTVSRVHCSLVRTKTGLWVVDLLGRGVGTLVDGQPVRIAQLQHGSLLSIGRFRARVSMTWNSSAGTSPTNCSKPAVHGVNGSLPESQLQPAAGHRDDWQWRDEQQRRDLVTTLTLPRTSDVAPVTPDDPLSRISHANTTSVSDMLAMIKSLVGEFAKAQSRLIAQVQQSTLEMSRIVAMLQNDQIDFLREELSRVHQINTELLALQRQSSNALELALGSRAVANRPELDDVSKLLHSACRLGNAAPQLLQDARRDTSTTGMPEDTSNQEIANQEIANQIDELQSRLNADRSAISSVPENSQSERFDLGNDSPSKLPPESMQQPTVTDRNDSSAAPRAATANASVQHSTDSEPCSRASVEFDHARLCDRISALQKERTSRWKKILHLFHGN